MIPDDARASFNHLKVLSIGSWVSHVRLGRGSLILSGDLAILSSSVLAERVRQAYQFLQHCGPAFFVPEELVVTPGFFRVVYMQIRSR